MIKLLKTLRECRPYRKEYRINPRFAFEYDNHNYYFSLIPTITWLPWVCRSSGFYMLDFWWLNFHLCFGRWERLDCKECKNQDRCIKEGRVKWYGDNIFEREYCRDYDGR